MNFIAGVYFYHTLKNVYSPAEIGMIRATFRNGIVERYHTYVNPQTVEQGYAYEAKNRYENVHGLPPPMELSNTPTIGETDYSKIYQNILNMIQIDQNHNYEKTDPFRPCIFTQKKYMEMMESILDQLSQNQWTNQFDLFEIEELFFLVEKFLFRTEKWTKYQNPIETDSHEYSQGISCNLHEQINKTKICALSLVNRWFYMLVKDIYPKMKIPFISNENTFP